MITPLLRFLVQGGYPPKFDVLVRASSVEALANHPFVAETIPYPSSRSLRAQKSLVDTLRRRGYSEAWVLHRSFRAALLVALAGIPVRIGYATEARSSLLTHSYPYHAPMHRAENHLSLASEYLRRPYVPLPLEFHIPPTAKRPAFLPDSPYFVVNPNASWETKRWLPESFAEVARRLRAHTGWLPVFIGSSSDLPLVSGVVSATGDPVLSLAGKTSWGDLAFLLREAQLFLTNDSGPMHLAVALQTPSVAIFGPTSPHRTGPYPPNSALVLRNLVPCSPCYLKKCPPQYEFRCMRGLTPDLVVSATLRYLAQRKEVLRP